jgi:glycosyltransferase involved in cell wall biosynthesis/2-polyprenyl-3-methyl-5-hydroxy-6-metoxy-1,4-benzoquinol methylase
MPTKAPVSLCIIVKNEPLLEKCLQSVCDHVEEVVIVDTGSTDSTPEVAKKYANIFEVFTACNNPETGLIEDFSMARQRSFDLATQPWIMWMDADDIIDGAQNLPNLIDEFNKNYSHLDTVSYLFPYEYSYNELGQCTLLHYRERLFYNKNCYHWVNPVHEVIIPKENVRAAHIPKEDLIFRHHRQFSPKVHEPGRNLRILKKYYEKVGDSDARQLYYLGLECANSGLVDEAVQHLVKYISVSGWEDERVMACLKLVDIYQAANNLDEGIKWAFKAIEIKENWGEGYFALAKMFYLLALRGGPTEMRNWERCTYFAKAGLALPPTRTLLFINPLERQSEIHKYLNLALSKLGDVKGALDSINIGIQKQPNDPHFVNNKKLYENFLARQKIVENTHVLKNNDSLSQIGIEQVAAIINNMPLPSAVKTDESSPFPLANTTNGPYEWSIPPTIDLKGLPVKMTDEQIQAVVILIWKQYMLHDELLSAISFLENAPYSVRHTLETQKALKLTKDCIFWLDNDKDFVKMNQPGNPEVESGQKIPMPLVYQEGGRFDLIADHLPPHTSLIDFGCMDGCFTNRYGLLGHRVVGLDAVESSINLANKKAAEFKTRARHIHTYFQEAKDKLPNELFEYATSSDTYEHLLDPVNDMLIPAAKMLKPNGKFLMCTPHGCWTRGQFVDFAYPWLQLKEGKSWLDSHLRPHLVAPTVWSVAKHFHQAGFWVKNDYVVLCEEKKDVEGQGNIFVEAQLQTPRNYPALDIVMFAGDGVETWTPETVKKTGIGGSELMLLEQAKRLAALGHKVRVYNSCGKYGEGIYDGVEYYQTNKYQDLQCDVLIVSRRADMLADQYNITAKLKLLWVHDVFAINATNELLLKADRILALSEWHKQNIINVHNVHPDHVIVTRNGIDLTRFDKKLGRNRFKCVNSSSPDRSWPILLDVWPQIKEQVPQAELHLYYGFKNWEYSAQFNKGQQDLIAYLKLKIQELVPLGVVYHDRVSQKQLAEEFLTAGCWTHPTWFTETSCISAMEFQAAGVRMVSSSLAALNETVADRGTLIDGDWTSAEYKAKFVQSVVQALNNQDDTDRAELQKYAREHFGLDGLSQNWSDMFYSLIEELKTNPVAPYSPTAPYKKDGRGYYDGDTRLKAPSEPASASVITSSDGKVKLNIACGPNVFPFEGWLNYDREDITEYLTAISKYTDFTSVPTHQKNLINYLQGGGRIFFKKHDLCSGFADHADNGADMIYLGQMIEHINPIYEAPKFLQDCYRMLKPNGLIRITTPDLDLLFKAYRDGEMDKFADEQPAFYKDADPSAQLAYLMYGAAGPKCSWNNYEGHMCLYTQKSMTNLLQKVGFRDIEFYYEAGKSKDATMAKECVDAGLSHSFIVEAVK